MHSVLIYGIPYDLKYPFFIEYEIEGLKWTINFLRKNIDILKDKKALEEVKYLEIELEYKEKRLAQREKDLIKLYEEDSK